MAPRGRHPPATSPLSGLAEPPSSQVAASNSTLKQFLGGRKHSWMANAAAVQPSPRPPHYQAPKPPPYPPGIRPATNQGGLTHPRAAAPQPSQNGQPAALSRTQSSLRPAQAQVRQPLASQSPPRAPPPSPQPLASISARPSVSTAVLPSPAPSEEPSPAVSTTYETTSPPGGGNPQSAPAPTASSKRNARATGPGTALARPPITTKLANGSVGAQGGRDSHQPSTSTMTAAPATTAPAMSLQTPPTSNDPIFSQGLPGPTHQTSDAAQEHQAKRRRMGDALLRDAAHRLETYLQALGGDEVLVGSVEPPRFQLIRNACQKGDLFFVALHQLFCFWSMSPHDFNKYCAQNEPAPAVFDTAFGLLSSILESNSTIRLQHLTWLSQFPTSLPGLCADSEYAGTIKNVLHFLHRMARFWTVRTQEHMRMGYPYLVDELLLHYQLNSEVLQIVIFRSSRRAMGVPDGVVGTQMDQVFVRDVKRHRLVVDGKVMIRQDYLSDPMNIALIESYQTILRQVWNQFPGSGYAPAPTTSSDPRAQQQQPNPPRLYPPYHAHFYSAYRQVPVQQQPHQPPVQQRQFGEQQPPPQQSQQPQQPQQPQQTQQTQHQHQHQHAYQQPVQARPARQQAAVSTSAHFGPQFPTGAPQQANGPSTSSPTNPGAGAVFAGPSNGINAPAENHAAYFASASPRSQQSLNGNGQATYASPLQSPIVSQAQSVPVQQVQGFRQHAQNMPQQFRANPALRRPSLQSRPSTLPPSPQLQHLPALSPRMPDGGVSPASAGGSFRHQQLAPRGRSSSVYPPQYQPPPAGLNTTMAPSPPSYFQPRRLPAPVRQSNMAQQHPEQPFVFTGGLGTGAAGQVRPSNVRHRTAAESRIRPSSSAASSAGYSASVPRVFPPIQVVDYPLSPHDRKSLISSLHQVDIRSPPRQLNQTVPRSAERYYQYIKYLPLEPSAIPPQQALYSFDFNIPEEVCALLSKSECPADGVPVHTFSDKSLRIRLRCVFRPKAAPCTSEGDWVLSDTQWPEHIFVKLNQCTLTIRRKQHHAKDQPVEIGHYVKPGANGLQLYVSDVQGKASKVLVPFVAVEVVETLSHSSVLGLPNLTANMPAADTRAIIKRRLVGTCGNGDDDDIAMVVSDLTVNLADPFSFCMFEVPVRGKDCTHLECFDLATWLNTRPAKSSCSCARQQSNCGVCPKEPSCVDKWKCPLCSGDARPRNLRIDGFLQEVREALATQDNLRAREILVSADGSWRPKTNPTDDQSDDDSDADAPKAKVKAEVRSRSATRPSEQRTPVVIELD